MSEKKVYFNKPHVDSLDNSEEAYCGEWESEEDFARHIMEECYNLKLKIAEYQIYQLKWGKLAESEEDLLEHRTDGTDAFDTLYIGYEKFPFRDTFALSMSGVV